MGDLSERPHVHVTGSGGHAKVWLDTLDIAESDGFTQAELRKILAAASERRDESLEKWRQAHERASD